MLVRSVYLATESATHANLVNLAIGVIGSILGVGLLFSIKPRLKLYLAKSPTAPRFVLVARNQRITRVVEVKARLLILDKGSNYDDRQEVELEHPDLFELAGYWARIVEGRTRYFRFKVEPKGTTLPKLGPNQDLLFQVWSKHSFSNFGRLHRRRFTSKHISAILEPESP